MTEREFTKIHDWPGYRVYRYEINEQTRTLKLSVRAHPEDPAFWRPKMAAPKPAEPKPATEAKPKTGQ